jgi:hypothetical protein
LPQIRAIFQPLEFDPINKTSVATDAGYHAIYKLSRDQFAQALNDVIAARKANSSGQDLGPLAVHPLMAKQGVSGPMAQALNKVFLKYASSTNLVRLAVFTFFHSHVWGFQAIDISGGKTTPTPILIDDGGQIKTSVIIQTEGAVPPKGLFGLPFTAPKSLKDNPFALLLPQLNPPHDPIQAAYDSAVNLENPHLHTAGAVKDPAAVDCVSCHSAALARVAGEGVFHLTPDAHATPFTVDGKVVPAADLAQSTPMPPPTTGNISLDDDFHAFSYNGTRPMINRRTINETAAILAYVKGG